MEAVPLKEEAVRWRYDSRAGGCVSGCPGWRWGLFLASGWGINGEQAAAQAPGSAARPVTGGVGKGRSAPSASAASSKGVTSGESGGILALIAESGTASPIQWLYVIDTKKRAFAIYRVDPTNPQGCVKLEASRQFRWDLDLDQYNNQGLEPADVKARVEAVTHSNP